MTYRIVKYFIPCFFPLIFAFSYADVPEKLFISFDDGIPKGWEHSELSSAQWVVKQSSFAGNQLQADVSAINETAILKYQDVFPEGRIKLIYKVEQAANYSPGFNISLDSNYSALWRTLGYQTYMKPISAGVHTIEFKIGAPTDFAARVKASVDSIRFIANEVDSDQDFIDDQWERDHGLNPELADDAQQDSDNDGLINELEFWIGSDPKSADSDSDGMSDFFEYRYGLNAEVMADANQDLDNDGLTNLEEYQLGSSPILKDSDADGLSDAVEVRDTHTSPINVDTDSDGYSDGFEISKSTSPVDMNDFPAAIKKLSIGFESPLSEEWGSQSGLSTFVRTDTTSQFGHFSLQPVIEEGNQAVAIYSGNFDQGILQFRYKLRDGLDRTNAQLAVSLVGVESSETIYSATTKWLTKKLEVRQGTPGIKFTYRSNGTVEGPGDIVIDDIRFLSSTIDVDGDLMEDSWEEKNLENPENGLAYLLDPDEDELMNQDEYWFLTSPTNPDSDSDSIPDGFEVLNGLNPLDSSDKDGDLDEDGLTNFEEFELKTNLLNSDTDGDGLLDGAEINKHKTNPNLSDSDQDGLSDTIELDTQSGYGTDALNPDSDGDGYLDGGEVSLSFDPMDSSSTPEKISFLKENFDDQEQNILKLKDTQMLGWHFLANNDLRPNSFVYAANLGDEENILTFSGYFEAGTLSFLNHGSFVDVEFRVNGKLQNPSMQPESFALKLEEGAYLVEISVKKNHFRGSNFYIDDLMFIADSRDVNGNNVDDHWENKHQITVGYLSDNDEDGISDQYEYVLESNPVNKDTDNDGLPDGFELQNSLNLFDPIDATQDFDEDGLANIEEYNLALRVTQADSDFDGLSDYEEVKVYGSNPKDPDTDNDKLDDGSEVHTHLTSPTESDTDSDGFTDSTEIRFKTDPLNKNSQPEVITDRFYSFEEGIPEGWTLTGKYVLSESGVADGNYSLSSESDYGNTIQLKGIFTDSIVSVYAEANAGSVKLSVARNEAYLPSVQKGVMSLLIPQGETYVSLNLYKDRWAEGSYPTADALRISLLDADSDGIPNYWESKLGMNASDPNDAALDQDDDGLSNLLEYEAGSDINNSDSDFDGMSDGWEYFHGTKVLENDALADYDGDSLNNLFEFEIGTSPQMSDTDQDKMPDAWEQTYDLNPKLFSAFEDTDSDGYQDLVEYMEGTVPNDKNSKPIEVPPETNSVSENKKGGGTLIFLPMMILLVLLRMNMVKRKAS